MELLTNELREMLPSLYSQEHVDDPLCIVKFFTPDSNWTWYAYEFDGEDLFFGWVCGIERELGYFSLTELEEARGPLGLPIERDLYFTPLLLSQVKKLHASHTSDVSSIVVLYVVEDPLEDYHTAERFGARAGRLFLALNYMRPDGWITQLDEKRIEEAAEGAYERIASTVPDCQGEEAK